jgi:hypothetical protein
MAITRSTAFIGTPVPQLISDLVLGAESIEKGIVHAFSDKRDKVYLNRFYTANHQLGARVATPVTAVSASTKDEKTITPGNMMYYDTFDPRDFEGDWDFLWSQGPSVSAEAATALWNAIKDTVTSSVNSDLEEAIWQGDTDSGSAWLAEFDGYLKLMDADTTVTDVTPQGAITAANVIGIFEDMVAACPAAVQEMSSPAIICSHTDKYFYREAARALDFKGTNIDEKIRDQFGGFPIVSTHGIPAGRVVMGNIGSGDQSNFKASHWMNSDRNNVKIERLQANSDLFFVKVALDFGVNTVYGKEIVLYKTA